MLPTTTTAIVSQSPRLSTMPSAPHARPHAGPLDPCPVRWSVPNLPQGLAMRDGSESSSGRRPPTVAHSAAHVAQSLREEPAISAAEILRRARALGYHGGKSAIY